MLTRLRALIDRFNYASFMLVGNLYVAAASLIGFEMLIVILGYTTVWPLGAPLAVVGIGAYVLIRRALRKPDDGDKEDGEEESG